MLVPADHIEIVGNALERNSKPGDPPVVILPEEDQMTEAPE